LITSAKGLLQQNLPTADIAIRPLKQKAPASPAAARAPRVAILPPAEQREDIAPPQAKHPGSPPTLAPLWSVDRTLSIARSGLGLISIASCRPAHARIARHKDSNHAPRCCAGIWSPLRLRVANEPLTTGA
jgi:hypothetical protein